MNKDSAFSLEGLCIGSFVSCFREGKAKCQGGFHRVSIPLAFVELAVRNSHTTVGYEGMTFPGHLRLNTKQRDRIIANIFSTEVAGYIIFCTHSTDFSEFLQIEILKRSIL